MTNTESIVAAITFIGQHPVAFFTLLAWTLAWKGLALWKAARLSHTWWFVILLVLNTLGVVEIIYIFFVTRRYQVEVEQENVSQE